MGVSGAAGNRAEHVAGVVAVRDCVCAGAIGGGELLIAAGACSHHTAFPIPTPRNLCLCGFPPFGATRLLPDQSSYGRGGRESFGVSCVRFLREKKDTGLN
jgi:hypothetical protein